MLLSTGLKKTTDCPPSRMLGNVCNGFRLTAPLPLWSSSPASRAGRASSSSTHEDLVADCPQCCWQPVSSDIWLLWLWPWWRMLVCLLWEAARNPTSIIHYVFSFFPLKNNDDRKWTTLLILDSLMFSCYVPIAFQYEWESFRVWVPQGLHRTLQDWKLQGKDFGNILLADLGWNVEGEHHQCGGWTG